MTKCSRRIRTAAESRSSGEVPRLNRLKLQQRSTPTRKLVTKHGRKQMAANSELEEFEFRARLESEMAGNAKPKAQDKSLLQWAKDDIAAIPGRIGNLAAGAVRGAGSIGATVLAPIDMASDAIDGK